MKRIIMAAAALLAVVPASLGLLGNASFAQSVKVRVPAGAIVLDDKGGQTTYIEPGDDKGGQSTHAEPGDDKGGQNTHAEPGDNKGGQNTHAVPGDDKSGSSTPAVPGVDKSGQNTHIDSGDVKVSDSGSGKGDNGVDNSIKSGRDDGSGHS